MTGVTELPMALAWSTNKPAPEIDVTSADETLFVAVRHGNDDALAILVDRYQRPLFGFLLRCTGRADLAAEVFQDAFVRAFEKRGSYDPRRPFKPWLYRIAANVATDRLRSEHRRPGRLTDAHPEPAATASPATAAAHHDLEQCLHQALASLSKRQRQVFVLRHYDGLSYEEIAAAVACPLNTVKSDMRRALSRIRRWLQERGIS